MFLPAYRKIKRQIFMLSASEEVFFCRAFLAKLCVAVDDLQKQWL